MYVSAIRALPSQQAQHASKGARADDRPDDRKWLAINDEHENLRQAQLPRQPQADKRTDKADQHRNHTTAARIDPERSADLQEGIKPSSSMVRDPTAKWISSSLTSLTHLIGTRRLSFTSSP